MNDNQPSATKNETNKSSYPTDREVPNVGLSWVSSV